MGTEQGDTATQPQTLPLWLRAVLTTQAAVQWAAFAAVVWFLPDGWVTVFNLSPPRAGALMLIVAGILSLLATLAWLLPRNTLLLAAYGILERVSRHPITVVVVGLCVAASLYFFQEAYLLGWAGHVLLGVQVLLIALLLYLTNPVDWLEQDGRTLALVPVFVILLGLGLRLWMMLCDFVWTDEGYRLGAIANMLQGKGLTPLMSHFPDNVSITPWRGYAFALYGLWARIFGLGLMRARALSYILGALALFPIHATTRMLYDRRTALLTTSFAALSLLFMRTTIARNDAFPMLAMSGVVWLHVYACQREKPLLHVAVGLLAGLALETHLTVLVVFVAVGGYYAVDYLTGVLRKEARWLRAAPLWYFLAGAIPGLVLFYVVHVVIPPYSLERFMASMGTGTPGGSLASVGNFVAWRLDTAGYRLRVLWRFSWPESLLILAATLAALIRRTKGDRHWLLLMVFLQLGYILVEVNGTIRHTLYGLPILLGSTGALITYGLGRQEGTSSLWRRLAYAGIVVTLVAWAVGNIQEHNQGRLIWKNERQPVLEYIRANLPPDSGIIAPASYYPYLIEYQNFLHPYHPIVDKGPALIGMETEAYWQNVLLETWPVARIEAPEYPNPQLAVHLTYMAARHAEEVVPGLWVVADGDLRTDAAYVQTDGDAALLMVAHVSLPPSVEAGSTLRLDSLWITRSDIGEDYLATLALLNAEGQPVVEAEQQLVSGWAGVPTSGWSANQFHDAALIVELPGDLAPGVYRLHLSLYTQTGGGSACEPGCRFVVDEVRVVP
jgi:hypothetical protein